MACPVGHPVQSAGSDEPTATEKVPVVPVGLGSLVHRRILLYFIVTTAGVLWHLLYEMLLSML